MPSPNGKTKLTGDTHLPDIDESQDTDDGNAQAADSGGEIKDKEAKTSNSYGNTRDSGERPEVGKPE